MGIRLVGNTLEVTGVVENLRELSTINGIITEDRIGTEDLPNHYTYFLPEGMRMVVKDGAVLNHNPDNEVISFNVNTTNEIIVENGGVYGYGLRTEFENGFLYTKGTGIIINDYLYTSSERQWDVTYGGIIVKSGGEFTCLGGTIKSNKSVFFQGNLFIRDGVLSLSGENSQVPIQHLPRCDLYSGTVDVIGLKMQSRNGDRMFGMTFRDANIINLEKVESSGAHVGVFLSEPGTNNGTQLGFSAPFIKLKNIPSNKDGNNATARIFQQRLMVFTNYENGAEVFNELWTGTLTASQYRGGIWTKKEISFFIKDDSKQPIENAKVFTEELSDGNEPTTQELAQYSAEDITNLATPKKYSFTTDENGETTTDTITTGIIYKQNFGGENTTPTANIRVPYIEDFNVYRIEELSAYVWSYLYIPEVVGINTKGIGVANTEKTLIVDKNVTEQDETIVGGYTKINSSQKLYDFIKKIQGENIENATSVEKGTAKQLCYKENGEVKIADGWGVILYDTAQINPVEIDSTNKLLTIYTGGKFNAKEKTIFNRTLIESDIDIVGDFTYTDFQNSETITNHTFNITALTNTSYIFEIIGINGNSHESIYAEELQGNQEVIKQIAVGNYESFELHISGGGVAEEVLMLTELPVDRNIDVVPDADFQQEWKDEFDRDVDPIKVSLASGNTKLTFSNNWDNLTLTRRLVIVDYMISIYNKGKPDSERLDTQNFITTNGSDLVYLVPITNTNYGTNQQADTYTSITFHPDNVSYLSQDIGVPTKTDTQGTSTINGLKVGDIVRIQEADKESTLVSHDITSDGDFVWEYELAKEYQVRAYRIGFDSDILNISRTQTTGKVKFINISGGEYTEPTGRIISDYLTFMEGGIFGTKDYVTSEDTFVDTSQPEINFWFEANQIAPYGIKANHLLSKIENGIITLTKFFSVKIKTHESTTYEFIRETNGTELKVSNNAEGIDINLVPSTQVSNIVNHESIKHGVHLKFINANNDNVYAEAICVGSLVNAGNDLFFDVTPALDPLSSGRNYRNKRIQFSTTHIDYVEYPTYQWSNQYQFFNTDNVIQRVDKHIAFLQRETINVSGGFTDEYKNKVNEISDNCNQVV